MARADEDIKREVVDELCWNSRIDASDVKVGVENGQVILTGTVPTYGARQEAYLCARGIRGVSQIGNRLLVEYPTTIEVPTDAELQESAQNVLRWSPEIDESEVLVAVEAGRVSLEGTVNALWKKQHAENLVSQIAGVLAIENKVAVAPSDQVADKAMAEEIVAALDRRLGIDATEVTVEVEDGAVTLRGTVPTWPERETAENAALHTMGVIDVDNRLDVNPMPAATPNA